MLNKGFLGHKAGLSRRTLPITCVATPNKPPATRLAKRSKVEIIKENSDFLRHPLMEQLVDDKTYISEDAVQLMKFHGSYMQDNREQRAFGKGKAYMFMMRTRQPAGAVTNQLYLAMDDLADQYGNETLRLTTRQAYQLHGVLKHDLKTVFSTVIKNMGSTLGACGDVNRNVMAACPPYTNRVDYQDCQALANNLADLLAPQSGAYYDIWLDGEKFVSVYKEEPKVTEDRAFNKFGTNFENSPEPIYGTQFLPRKFKIAVTVPGDNSVDLFTNDIGIVVIMDDANKEVKGYNIVVGGGMGRTHRAPETFPRLADALCYVDKEDIYHAVKAIVACQRDYGRRDDRRQARLKYLVHEWGIDRFRTVTETYFGKKFKESVPLPEWQFEDYLGWGDQGDGKLFYGIYVQNGRIKGEAKKAMRQIIEKYKIPVTITPHQNLILRDLEPAWKKDVLATLTKAGVKDVEEWDSIERTSMACPALPMCGLAVTEAERGLPDVNARLRVMLEKAGVSDAYALVRMTGCPNGCARPYMAEIGFVGDGPNSYQIYMGGNPAQTRLATLFEDRVKLQDFETFFEPLFVHYAEARTSGEGFGDFVTRVGNEALKKVQAAAAAAPAAEVEAVVAGKAVKAVKPKAVKAKAVKA
eukprot:gene17951-24355_t